MPALWPSPSFGGGLLPDRVFQGAEMDEENPMREDTEFDVGPPQTFLKGTAPIELLEFQMTLAGDDTVNELTNFYTSTLVHGSLTFLWELPNAHGTLRTMQFIEKPKTRWVEATLWRASVRIRVLP